MIKNAPVFEGGEAYRVQQGAGMAVAKSDKTHEYAASVFLKWFTQSDNSLKFGSASGYLPVRTTGEVIQYIRETEKEFDPERIRAFRNKFMSACDGHATDRLIELVTERRH